MALNDTFQVPPYDTKDDRGEVGFAYAFTLTLDYDGPHETETARGGRIYKGITGGAISGRINGQVYRQGGGEYSLRRDDDVIDVKGHVLLKAENGEWLHLQNLGYDRPGYVRVLAWVDADTRGNYTWTQGLFFVGHGEPSEDGKRMTITYYEAR
jgi:hypothetical protein